MGTVSVSLPSDGSTADVSDYNTPITTIVNEMNGNIDNANIKSAAAIDFAKIAGGSSSALGAWQDWTPTLTGITIGNGTVVAKYIQIGKTVHFRLSITFGGTSSASGGIAVTLPVTSATYLANTPIGTATMTDSGSGNYMGHTHISTEAGAASTSKMTIFYGIASTTNLTAGVVSATAPFSFGNSDIITMTGTYEAA